MRFPGSPADSGVRVPKITKRFVESLTTDDVDGRLEWDDAVPGFGVRVRPSGRKAYVVQYRTKQGRLHRRNLGVHGAVTPAQARRLAQDCLGDVAAGGDPAEKLDRQRRAPTVRDLADDYLERHAEQHKRPSSLRNDRAMLERSIIPRLGKLKVDAVTLRDLEALHRLLRRTPYRANRVLALLSKMFSLAVRWGWRGDNPVQGIQRFSEHARERWLSTDELTRLTQVLQKHPNQRVAPAVRLILLTGARKSEVLTATWDQFDLERGVWTKPAHATKQGRQEHFPLSRPAIELLQEMKARATGGPFLFPGDSPGKPLQNMKRFWRSLCRDADLEGVRIHDLRHTFASHLVSGGTSLPIVGRLLGHTQAATTQRYSHLADDPLREASDKFGELLTSVGSPQADRRQKSLKQHGSLKVMRLERRPHRRAQRP